MAPRPAPAEALMDELLEGILLRVPPDDPASLLRAALVCKRWGRIVSDPGFRRRFREFHRTPPMLGFLCSGGPRGPCGPCTSFVSTSSFRPSPGSLNYKIVDARHGRVLLHDVSWNRKRKFWDDSFMVWDPIAGGEPVRLPWLPLSMDQASMFPSGTWNAAVLCASAADANACDNLECHSGPFMVVFVASRRHWGSSGMCAIVYSSGAVAWSQWIYALHLDEEMRIAPSVLAGNSMYFLCTKSVLKFDLATRGMSLIDLPQEIFGRPLLRATADGGLGLATVRSGRQRRARLYLWSREVGPDEDVGWAQNEVIKLRELLRAEQPLGLLRLTGSVHGLDIILVSTSVGIFTIHLKSGRVTKEYKDWMDMGSFTFPYMSFYIPGMGAAFSDGSGIGTSNAS